MERRHSDEIIRYSKTISGEHVAFCLEDATYTEHLLDSGKVTSLYMEFVPQHYRSELLPSSVEKFYICVDQTNSIDFGDLQASIILKPDNSLKNQDWAEQTIDHIRQAMYSEVEEIYEPDINPSDSQCYLQLDDQTSLSIEVIANPDERRIDITRVDTILVLDDANAEFDIDADITIASNYKLFLKFLKTLVAGFDSLGSTRELPPTIFNISLDMVNPGIEVANHLAEVIPINDTAARFLLERHQASLDQNS